ncbi:MAG: PilZ domain-containing protein [Magnetococcales bacterium]|nr:PilZ domain-containing protein [Magnetococcales bacterium]
MESDIKSGKERRHFTRVHFQHDITLNTPEGKSYSGAFSDISLKGMLFFSEPLPPKGTLLRGVFPLGEEQMVLQGWVINAHPERGAAILFVDLDLESFSHLRRLVGLNMGDAETIDREFFDSL